MKTQTINIVKIVLLASILSVGVAYIYAAPWTGPTSAPPGGNVEAPINVSSNGQIKTGPLTVGSLTSLTLTHAFGGVDTHGGKIINLGDPVDPMDAVNLRYLQAHGGSGGVSINSAPGTGSFSVTSNSVWQNVNIGVPGAKAVMINMWKTCRDFMLETALDGTRTGLHFTLGTSGDAADMGSFAIIPVDVNGNFQYKGYGPSGTCSRIDYYLVGTVN